MGLQSLLAGALAVNLEVWNSPPYPSSCGSTCYNIGHEGITSNASDEGSDGIIDFLLWDFWETCARQLGSSSETCCAVTVDRSVCSVPSMPISDHPQPRNHREKIAINSILDNLCVARPVGKAKIACAPAANAAMQENGNCLRSTDVWGESEPREWDGAGAEAKQKGFTAHMSYLLLVNVLRQVGA